MSPSRFKADEDIRRNASGFAAFTAAGAAPITPAKYGTPPDNSDARRDDDRAYGGNRDSFGGHAQGTAQANLNNLPPQHGRNPDDVGGAAVDVADEAANNDSLEIGPA